MTTAESPEHQESDEWQTNKVIERLRERGLFRRFVSPRPEQQHLQPSCPVLDQWTASKLHQETRTSVRPVNPPPRPTPSVLVQVLVSRYGVVDKAMPGVPSLLVLSKTLHFAPARNAQCLIQTPMSRQQRCLFLGTAAVGGRRAGRLSMYILLRHKPTSPALEPPGGCGVNES
jgi:hypothetical protein